MKCHRRRNETLYKVYTVHRVVAEMLKRIFSHLKSNATSSSLLFYEFRCYRPAGLRFIEISNI